MISPRFPSLKGREVKRAIDAVLGFLAIVVQTSDMMVGKTASAAASSHRYHLVGRVSSAAPKASLPAKSSEPKRSTLDCHVFWFT